MDTTHEHTSEKTTLRDRVRGIRRPWRDVWTAMLAAPVGAALVLGLGFLREQVDPCDGLECIWPFAVVVVALYVLGAWVAIAGLTWIAERVELNPRGVELTVRFLTVATWAFVLYGGGAMLYDLVFGL